MHCLQVLLAFACCCVITANAVCTSSKYNLGTRDWLRCSGVSFVDVQNNLQSNLIAISVSQSAITELPNLGFIRSSNNVENLNFHDCGISQIGNEAFRGLSLLKKLSLPYNNITKLNGAWFNDIPLLEQLDVSFNLISELDSNIYLKLSKLQRFELNDNRLNCVTTHGLENIRNLREIRIHENPLTYSCRAQLTRWLKDHKISYATDEDNFIWLDDMLWRCYYDFEQNAGSDFEKQKKMNVCVITTMFHQLTTVLGGSPSIQSSMAECGPFRTSLTQCFRNQNIKTNGDVLINLLGLMQKESKITAP